MKSRSPRLGTPTSALLVFGRLCLALKFFEPGQRLVRIGLGFPFAARAAEENRLALDRKPDGRAHRAKAALGVDDAPLLRIDERTVVFRQLGALGCNFVAFRNRSLYLLR